MFTPEDGFGSQETRSRSDDRLTRSCRAISARANSSMVGRLAAPDRNAPAGARVANDPSVADRFELFIGPVELANGYVELTNAEEQALRMRRDNEERERRGRPVRPVDNNLLAALRDGLPQCAGVAVGFERLQMIHDRTDDIRDVITFAFDTDT